ncbi:tryptophan synthase subunit alpha [Spongiactinospora sp. 9N601]|uniref:tryptophan synthase subunit alpha n=1 Tax=Spongiactinospora sp. 9N601 TaxID=3375149 RepID=UPI0037A2A2EC
MTVPRIDRRGFFTGRPDGEPGLAVFLNAGDLPWPVLTEVAAMLDERGVECLELAVPFPGSPTDGEVIRASARRALEHGTDLAATLAFVREIRPRLRCTRIALLADWSCTIRPEPLPGFLAAVRDSGADALLPHGLPPRLKRDFHESAARAGLPIVTTCYPASDARTRRWAVEHGTAYLYLVAGYGRSGVPRDYAALAPVIAELGGGPPGAPVVSEPREGPPVAVGFGVRERADVVALHRAGADAVIVGSAFVARAETARSSGGNVAARLDHYLSTLRSTATATDPESTR